MPGRGGVGGVGQAGPRPSTFRSICLDREVCMDRKGEGERRKEGGNQAMVNSESW